MGVASSSQSPQSASQLSNKTPNSSDFSDHYENGHCDAPGADEQCQSTATTSPGLDAGCGNSCVDQSALRFHDVCGKNIEFLNGKRMAKRKEDHFCDAIVFSHRPVGVYERVYVKVIKLSSFWNGMMRFGFTSVNPDAMNPARRAPPLSGTLRGQSLPRMDSLNGSTGHSSSMDSQHASATPATADEQDDLSSLELPKYVYPDLTNKEGYWAASMAENSIKENDVLYFYVNSNGEIHYGINDKYQGLFLDGIDVYRNRPRQAQPLWAIFDIYGNTIAIEFVNHSSGKYQHNGGSSQQFVKQSNQTAVGVLNSNLVNFDSLSSSSAGPVATPVYVAEQVSAGAYRTLTSINSLGSNGSSIRSTGSSMQASTSSNPSSMSSSSVAAAAAAPRSSQLVTATAVSSRPSRSVVEAGGLAKVISSAGQAVQTTGAPSNDAEDQFDQLLISCRRLCVDNHLNETLHNSLVQLQNPVACVTSTPPTSTATAFSSPPAPANSYAAAGRSCSSAATATPSATSTPTTTTAYESSFSSAVLQSHELTNVIRRVYESIPVLLHEPITNSRVVNNKFMTSIHGRNVKISQPDRLIAYRPSSLLALTDRFSASAGSAAAFKKPTTNGYVFFEAPVERGHSFCIQIVGLDQSAHESSYSLGIGCTTCLPATLNQQIDLPDDADELVDRPEYWVVYKNLFTSSGPIGGGGIPAAHVAHNVSIADELCFRLEDSGNVNFYINGRLKTKCLFSVDATQKLWFFFDLCGRTSAIRLIPPCSHATASSSSSRGSSGTPTASTISTVQVRSATGFAEDEAGSATSAQRRPRPNSALIDYYKNQILLSQASAPPSSSSDASTAALSTRSASQLPASQAVPSAPLKSEAANPSSGHQEECRICWEAPIECVFYSCGHMCLCWNCASRLKKQAAKSSSTSASALGDPVKKPNKYPLCPICRMEIIDIIRFFKS